MKTHYMTEDNHLSCNSQVGFKYSENHKQTTCLLCIENMSDNQRAWHDKNNQEWNDYVKRSPAWTMVD